MRKMSKKNNTVNMEDFLKILRRLQTIKGHLFSKL